MSDEDGYQGEAALRVDDLSLTVTVTLRGNFEPVDGRYHWYGRIHPNPALATHLAGRKATATVVTPHGEAPATLSDPDTWGRYRITGTSTPPFPVPVTLADLPAGS
jgi:hypothetical protein